MVQPLNQTLHRTSISGAFARLLCPSRAFLVAYFHLPTLAGKPASAVGQSPSPGGESSPGAGGRRQGVGARDPIRTRPEHKLVSQTPCIPERSQRLRNAKRSR